MTHSLPITKIDEILIHFKTEQRLFTTAMLIPINLQRKLCYKFALNAGCFCYQKECGVRLPATQKALNRLVWWKGKFASFQMPQLEGRADVCPKANTPTGNQWGKNFYRQKEGDACRNRTVSCNSHLLIGHLDCSRYS